jgi:hypothetical protein
MRVGHGAARDTENLADFQVGETTLFRYVKRTSIEWCLEARHAATLAIAVVAVILARVTRSRE